jgi:hypothetical protein
VGAAPLQNILFELSNYIDVDANGGAVQLGETTSTQEPTVTGTSQVTSMGTFAGPNGPITWTAVSAISPGTTRYVTALTFSSASPFGAVRLVQYADIDVPPFPSNDLVVLGTFGEPGFQLVTAQNPAAGDIGLRQLLPVTANAGCIGWAAAPFPQLRNLITGAGTTYTPAGNLLALGATTDPRFPGAPAFGPADITSAIACDLSPGATSASIVLTVSAEAEVTATSVPTLGEWAFIALAITLVAFGARTLRRRPLSAA